MLLQIYIKVLAASIAALLLGVLLGFVIFPRILKSQLRKEMTLSPKTDTRKNWEKAPFPLEFRVFVFNYTNAKDVQNGAVPMVEEIGPYFFDEWKEKVNIEDDDVNDTVSFRKQDTFVFRRDLSGELSGEELVILPDIFLMSLATMTLKLKPLMMPVLSKAIHSIFDQPTSIFMSVKVMDLLFRGVNINCDRKEFVARAACSTLKKDAADSLVFEPNNQFKFSIFGMQNSTPGRHVISVKRGLKNVMDVGQVIALDGAHKQTVWKDHCNELEGTDGTIFAPFLTENDRLISYAENFCRSFKPWFQRNSDYAGISTRRYISNIGDLANSPELSCYCEHSASCIKGLMDLAPCTNAPLYLSLPHYYDSNTTLLNNVKGLSPSADKHSQYIDLEPLTGTPLQAKLRVMFNLRLIRSNKMELLRNLPDSFAPLFWVEESLALNETYTKMLKSQVFTPKKIILIVSCIFIALGILGILTGSALYMKDKMTLAASVTKIDPQPDDTFYHSATLTPAKITS